MTTGHTTFTSTTRMIYFSFDFYFTIRLNHLYHRIYVRKTPVIVADKPYRNMGCTLKHQLQISKCFTVLVKSTIFFRLIPLGPIYEFFVLPIFYKRLQ